MPVRFETEIDTINTADVYKLQIIDNDYTGSAIAFDALGPDGFTISYAGKGDFQRFNPIFATSLTFKISVTSSILSDVESFIDDMVQSGDESRFKLKAYKNDNIYWTGIVLIDRVTKSIPLRSLEVRAIDGLGRIQSIDYNNDGVSYSGKQTIRQHFFNCFEKLGTFDLYDTSDVFFRSLVTWSEDSLTYDINDNILDNARLNHLALIKVDKSGNVSYNNTYRVLEELTKFLGARLFISEGSWQLWQVNEFKSATRAISNYTKSGTKTLSITSGKTPFAEWNVTGDTDVKMTSGEIEWFAPLALTICDYKHYSTKNLAKTLTFYEAEGTIEDVDALGATSRISFSSIITTFSSYTAATYRGHYQKFRLKIKVGDFYLKRTAKISNTGAISYGNMSWQGTVEWYEFFTPLLTTKDPNTPITFPLEFITPPIPQDGNLVAEFQYVNIYLLDGSVPELIDPPTGYDIADADIVVLTLGTVDSETNVSRYEVRNSIDGNSDIIEYETLFGDGPSGNSYGAIEVFDGENWILSDGWRRKTEGDAVAISQLLINEVISGQSKPVEKIRGSFIGSYEAHYTIKDPAGNHYVFNGGTFQARKNEWAGEWFNIETANTVAGTEVDKKEFIDDPVVRTDLPTDLFVPDIPLRGLPKNTNPVYFNPSSPFVNIDVITRLAGERITGETELSYIPIVAIEQDGLINEGDYITMLDPTTGVLQEFVVAKDVLAGDTAIAIESVIINEDGFNPDSLLLYSTKEIALNASNRADMAKIKEKWYSQAFSNVTGSTVTITENSGVLPDIVSHVLVYVDGIHQDIGWYIDGSTIRFNWTLQGNYVYTRFLITTETVAEGCCEVSSGLPVQYYKETFVNVYDSIIQVTVGGGALPTNTNNISVFVDGVFQDSGYTIQNSYIYFDWTLSGNSVHIQFFVDNPKIYQQSWDNVTGTSVTLSSKLAQMAAGSNRYMVFVDGVHQDIDFILSGSTLTFNWSLDNNNVHLKVFKP